MKRLLGFCIGLLLALSTLGAQQPAEKAPEGPKDVTAKLFELEHADPADVYTALHAVVSSDAVREIRERRAIVVKAPKELMPAVEEIVRRLDVPKPVRNVDLTVYIVQAGQEPGAGKAAPPELEPVLKQFRGVFAYKSFEILDSVLLRTRERAQQITQGSFSYGNRMAKYRLVLFFRQCVRDRQRPIATGAGPQLRN